MNRLLALATLSFLFVPAADAQSQSTYWQQHVNYTIDVSLNDQRNTLKGLLSLEYTNNSPDKLEFIWFHLWPNAYKNEKTAFVRQLSRERDGRKRWKDMKDKGYMDSLDFMAEGARLTTAAHPEHIDIIKVFLSKPLASGDKVVITTPFFVKLPTYISRMGQDKQSYIICQWYPKPAVYDRKGWHEMPYLDQGEFYSEFGSFTVNITLPSAYVVGASGALQTAEEYRTYKELGSDNARGIKRYIPPTNPLKTLSYKAENVHDFAWFADKNFVIQYDTLQLNSGKIIDVFAYHQRNGNSLWRQSTDFIEDAVKHYSTQVGEYPYPVVAAVEGPRNLMSGGMEYPMITHITSPEADQERLDAVITHEVGHNWFYSILGSNERVHAWMDEGINTYYQFRYEAEKYKSNSIFGDEVPQSMKSLPTDQFMSSLYSRLSSIPMDKPFDTHSALFSNKEEYGMVVYLKTAIWMYILELNVGKEKLDSAMQAYFDEWKFRHPYPEDFQYSLERSLNMDLKRLFDIKNKSGSLQ